MTPTRISDDQVFLLLLCPIIAAAMRLFFGGRNRNYTESLVLCLFLITQLLILGILYSVFTNFVGKNVQENSISLFTFVFLFLFLFLIYVARAFEAFYAANFCRCALGALGLFLVAVYGAMVLIDILNFLLFNQNTCWEGGPFPLELYRCEVTDTGLLLKPITQEFGGAPSSRVAL